MLANRRHGRDLAMLGAGDDQRLTDMFGGEVIAGFLDPGFAADAKPFLEEQCLFLEFVKFLIRIAGRRQGLGLIEFQDGTREALEKTIV